LIQNTGFENIQMYGINSDCNWRSGTNDDIQKIIQIYGDNHPLLKNTIMVLAKK